MADVLAFLDALHRGESWRPWRAFVKAVYGHPLDDAEFAIFREHTAREAPREGGYAEAVAIVGVQSGKSSIAGTLTAHAALTGQRGTHALNLAQDHRAAQRALFRYARQPFEEIDAFRHEVARASADTLELRNGVSLAVYPCRPASIRGLRASIVVVDELAFFTSTDGRPTDTEMLRAARGRVATTGGKVVVLSSPYASTGALYDLHRRHYGREDSDTLVWQASAPEMNPSLPADYLARMEQDDPEAYRSEVLGQFRSGTSTLLDPEVVSDCVPVGVHERERLPGVKYHGFVDVSGGRHDSFCLAIAHAENDCAVLDLVRERRPPFSPEGVAAEYAATLRAYHLLSVEGDRYSGEFAVELFRKAGIRYRPASQSKSELYVNLAPLVNSGRVTLLDDARTLAQLRALERTARRGGREQVDHPRGGSDDRINAAAGALLAAKPVGRIRRAGVLF